MSNLNFTKSDIGAQAAWKGFSSQTLYIAYRLLMDEDGCEYYPEDIEDLVIKKDGTVVEAIQIKNISSDLTLSSLASTKTSIGGEGFFNRMCSLHAIDKSFSDIKIVYFGELGTELQGVANNNKEKKKILANRLREKHQLSSEDAIWLIDSLQFEKVSLGELEESLKKQIGSYVPVMPAPILAQELLVQYISKLSNSKGHTTLAMWKDKIHEIGVGISAIDGFYKEYNKSLICLSELQLNTNQEQLRNEFSQGVSAHPAHIRCGVDIKRNYWLKKIQFTLERNGVVVIKGVSGQGKSALCYRYLFDTYPEGCVFCVRTIATETQAQNLVAALDGLGKHNENLIIYIDVQPGEILWAFLIQELQTRGLKIPVLVSIRDEDYNTTPLNGKAIKYDVVELALSKEEAENIYNIFTSERPHPIYRTFGEAWIAFGNGGPLIEFVYLLSNNQTLTDRLQYQIDALIKEKVSDDWLELLQMVCYAGRLGANVDFQSIKKEIHCSTMHSAIQRLKDEYLIRVINENKIEALHPVRAQIVFDTICLQTGTTEKDIIFKTIPCVESKNIRVILMDYFSHQSCSLDDLRQLSRCEFTDWVGFASVIKTMLWLDAKRYVDYNIVAIRDLIKKRGKGWLCFLPLDLSGVYHSNEIIADNMKELSIFKDKEAVQRAIDETKNSLTSLTIDYQATDYFVKNCCHPILLPQTDEDKSAFGYALFWMSKRDCEVHILIEPEEIVQCICSGELQAAADVVRGLSEHTAFSTAYQVARNRLVDKLISEMNVISFIEDENEIVCKFIPPLENEVMIPEEVKNLNQYWRIKMLDILEQMYPQKEYIDIELLGVDLLDDLGIEPLDYKLRMQKDKRYNTWVTEVNGWVKNRIDYTQRPRSWGQYVTEIDAIRTDVNKLIEQTIRLIDDIYKKGRYTKERWKRIEEQIDVFRRHIFAENHLPISAVDPYCLYSEGKNNMIASEYFPMRQLLSVEKYKNFRKYFNKVYTSLDNFYNQFAEVLLARIRKKDLTSIKNPRLAMFNLYSATEAFCNFCFEYDSLFLGYSSLSVSFAHDEEENLLTLLNVWRYVLDNPPKGQEIAYDAKLRYRKGKTFFHDTLTKIPSTIGGKLLVADHYAYIVKDYNVDEDNTLEKEYASLVCKLRSIFQSAVLPSSDRWYCETQPKELAYIPVIVGSYSPMAFSIPFYRLFDSDVADFQQTILPCEIEPEVKKDLFTKVDVLIWIAAMQKVQEIKLWLKRFQQIILIEPSENCIGTFELFCKKTEEKIQSLWSEFAVCERIVDELIIDTNEQIQNMVETIKTFCNFGDEVIDCVRNRSNIEEVINIIGSISTIMLLLQSLVSNIEV
ncbi:MAG: hypothetical protein ACLVEN_01810 [Anaerotignum lactatifermentans]|uniref:hypothetical protein n=1 Tax=Anaerotignum lactatifermentans TaxID=160404 RepID=UPI00399C0BF7